MPTTVQTAYHRSILLPTMRWVLSAATLAMMLAGLTSCTSPSFGEGIGTPGIGVWDVPEFQPLPIALTAVDRSDADSAQWNATIETTGSEEVQLDFLMLCNAIDCLDLAGPVSTNGTVSLEDLDDLRPEVGALAIVDSQNFWGHGFLAWGADATTTGHRWASIALAAGVATEGEFEPVCFPASVNPCDRRQSLRIVEVDPIVDSADTEASIVIENTSPDALGLRGVRLCVDTLNDGCLSLTASNIIEAGARLRLFLASSQESLEESALDVRSANLSLGTNAQLILLAPGVADTESTEAEALWMSYIAYGAVGDLAMTAEDLGLWSDDATFVTSPTASAETLSFTGADITVAGDWTISSP